MNTAPSRTELLDCLRDLLACVPEMRLGQLICNVTTGDSDRVEATWDTEDMQLFEAVNQCREDWKHRIIGEPAATPETRRDLFDALANLSQRIPLALLISHLAFAVRGPAPESIWDVEDDELLTQARGELSRVAAALPIQEPISLRQAKPMLQTVAN